jgi:phosphopantothenate synthetase
VFEDFLGGCDYLVSSDGIVEADVCLVVLEQRLFGEIISMIYR